MGSNPTPSARIATIALILFDKVFPTCAYAQPAVQLFGTTRIALGSSLPCWRSQLFLRLSSSQGAPAGTKPFSSTHEVIVKQKAEYSVVTKTGTAAMQFIFDLIWNQSRSKYLVAIAEQEAGQ